MKLEFLSYQNGQPIPGEFAFCVPADEGHVLAQASWVGTYTLNPTVEA